MAKIDITKTELVWPGKYNDDGTINETPRVNLPFQVIETVNESRVTRESQKSRGLTLFDVYEAQEGDTFEEGWRNKLIWGDNLLVMGSLLQTFAGRIDLIYIDPPFAIGADFTYAAQIGESGPSFVREQSVIEEKAYRDTWHEGTSSYLNMIRDRLVLMRDLLANDGTIYVHCDSTVNYLLRSIMDEVFGKSNFRNEVIWRYGKMSNTKKKFPANHDTILRYSKSESYTFNPIKEEESEYKKRFVRYLTDNRVLYGTVKTSKDKLITGRISKVRRQLGRALKDEDVLFDFNSEFKVQDDVFTNISIVKGNSRENLGYPTQKPLALVDRLIKASSNEGALIADLFCGSGTTLAAAENLNRRWIGCDLGRWSIHVTRKRLLEIDNCKPFELLNLGKYERQYWQGVTFGAENNKTASERALYEYLAFILKLYGAQPITGTAHVHGRTSKAMVSVGAVDAPVTIEEINDAIDECVMLRQEVLHVLGWEWEMGLAGPNTDVRSGGLMHDVAQQKGVRLFLFQIPREVMEQYEADHGAVRFFELAYLKAAIAQNGLTIEVTLEDFVIPNAELIPDDARNKIDRWSDYIDYWAVDWDFRNDTFMQGWVTYRTRQARTLALTSDSHTYPDAGRYRVLIKVIDIFGNDTSQVFDVKVR